MSSHNQPHLQTVLIERLTAFATNPAAFWGSDSIGANVIRNIETGDRNTARVLAGDYTDAEYADFDAQCVEIERYGSGTAYFPGEPNSLPGSVGIVIECSTCGNPFRTNSALAKSCYDCVLERICPAPEPHSGPFREYWKRGEWSCMANGIYGYRNQVDFFWDKSRYGTSSAKQGIQVNGSLGSPTAMTFSTVIRTDDVDCTYDINFGPDGDNVTLRMAKQCSSINWDDRRGNFVTIDELPEAIIIRMLEMLPPFLLARINQPA